MLFFPTDKQGRIEATCVTQQFYTTAFILVARFSSKFPAMAILSKMVSFSQIAGSSQKLLKESPRQLSCCRLPSSSGKDVRKFPSSQQLWRLQK